MEQLNMFYDEKERIIHSEVIKHLARHGDIRFFQGLPRKWTGTHFKEISDAIIERKIMQLFNDDIPTKDVAEIMRRIRTQWFDPVENNIHPNLLNLENGILQLPGATLIPHDPKFGFNHMIPIQFDAESKCPKFKNFLTEIFDGDKDKVRFIQDFFGYCLRHGNPDHKMLWLFGDGRNGKSTLLRVLEALLGETNVATLTLAQTSEQFLSYKLKDKLANIADENSCDDKLLNTETIKLLSSEGKMTTRKIYGDCIEFRFLGKLIYSLNAIPRFKDYSDAFKERVIILIFKKQFLGKTQVQNLEQQFIEELPGILNWAIRGLQRITRQGKLLVPDSIKKDGDALLDEGNSPIQFIKLCCTVKEKAKTEKEKIYAEYKKFCEDSKLYAASNSVFFKRIRRKLGKNISEIRPRSNSRKRMIRGLKLLSKQ